MISVGRNEIVVRAAGRIATEAGRADNEDIRVSGPSVPVRFVARVEDVEEVGLCVDADNVLRLLAAGPELPSMVLHDFDPRRRLPGQEGTISQSQAVGHAFANDRPHSVYPEKWIVLGHAESVRGGCFFGETSDGQGRSYCDLIVTYTNDDLTDGVSVWMSGVANACRGASPDPVLRKQWQSYANNGRVTQTMAELRKQWQGYANNGRVTQKMEKIRKQWQNRIATARFAQL